MGVTYKYSAGTFTDIGPKYKNNEDSHLLLQHRVENDMIIFGGIADGIGGLGNGNIASSFVIESLREWFILEKEKFILMDAKNVTNELYEKVLEIHEALKIFQKEKAIDCGTTLTAILIRRDEYIIIHVGDSRVYALENEEIKMITKDQTLAQLNRDRGEEKDLGIQERIKMESTLLQCIGKNNVVPKIYVGAFFENYAVLLCSDGLSNTLTVGEIKEEIEKERRSEKERLSILAAMARKKGEKDNISALLIRREKGC